VLSTPGSAPVLVVGDDTDIASFIRGALEDEGLVVMTATDAGQAVALAGEFGPDLMVLDVTLPGMSSQDPHRQPDVPLLIVAYRLLGAVACGLNQRVKVVAWEHPWVRSFRPDGQARLRHARLPAAAELALEDETMRSAPFVQVLLLPDLGTAPVARHRPLLRTLLELRQCSWAADNRDEPLLVVATADPAGADTRMAAWRSLLQHVALGSDEPPLRARVLGTTDVSQ
jgi:hypothetical protein